MQSPVETINDLLLGMAVVVIVNDNVFVNVTCGGVTATVVDVALAGPTI